MSKGDPPNWLGGKRNGKTKKTQNKILPPFFCLPAFPTLRNNGNDKKESFCTEKFSTNGNSK